MNRYLILNILLAELLLSVQLFPQNAISPESEYQRIKTLAFDGDYAAAASAARKLVNTYPSYGDARILLSRILAWQRDYINARAVIDTLLLKEPGNEDALSARRDILLWTNENTPVSTDLRAGYSFDRFRQPYSRFFQIINIGAAHRYKWGPAYAGLNIGNFRIGAPSRSSAYEWQLEFEAWPEITSKNYADLSYAFSPGPAFPRHRATAELWQILPAGWVVSGGINYYYFDRNAFIALASVEKYLGKYWLSLKGFVCFKDIGPRASVLLKARRYFNDRDYLQISLGTGAAPDEPFNIQTNLLRLYSNNIRLMLNKSLTNKLIMRIGAGYSREEYIESIWRDRFEGNINFIYAIKMK